jgi:hypothetical protein
VWKRYPEKWTNLFNFGNFDVSERRDQSLDAGIVDVAAVVETNLTEIMSINFKRLKLVVSIDFHDDVVAFLDENKSNIFRQM